MKRLLIFITLLLTPSFLYASASGTSASASMDSAFSVITAINLTKNLDMIFPTLIDGMPVDNLNTEMPAQVGGGAPGQDAQFTVSGERGYCYSVTAGDKYHKAVITHNLSQGTLTYYLSVTAAGQIPFSGTDTFVVKGDFSDLNPDVTALAGVYTGNARVTVTYAECSQWQQEQQQVIR